MKSVRPFVTEWLSPRTTYLVNTLIVICLLAKIGFRLYVVYQFRANHLMQVIATPYWKPARKHYDMACGPTGLEEMVHADPVCAQVGFPFLGLLNSV